MKPIINSAMKPFIRYPFIKYLLIVVVTALVIGGGTYLYEHHQTVNTDDKLSSQIVSLQEHITSLNSQVSTLKSAAAASLSLKSSAINLCNSSNLSASLVNGNGAAGTYYYDLDIKNVSDKSCTFNGVTAVFPVNSSGKIIGSDADTNAVANFNLAANQSIYADTGFPDPGNFSPGECSPNVTSLAVYPPGEITPLTISTNNITNGGDSCTGFSMNPFSTTPTGS